MKQDNGADYIMTQLCWDMEQFKVLAGRDPYSAGVTMPVDVGIMPILDQAATINMALSRNGCVMERELCKTDLQILAVPESVRCKGCRGQAVRYVL